MSCAHAQFACELPALRRTAPAWTPQHTGQPRPTGRGFCLRALTRGRALQVVVRGLLAALVILQGVALLLDAPPLRSAVPVSAMQHWAKFGPQATTYSLGTV